MLEIKATDKLLIVAPHPDDESIGCGGLLSKYGSQCDVLLLTDGRMGHGEMTSTEDELVKIREREFCLATSVAKVRNIKILRIHDQMLLLHKKEVRKIDITEYDYIFVPNRDEFNLDHKAVYPIIKRMMRRQKSGARLLEYEVWSPLNKPNQALALEDCMDQKIALVSCYKSQLTLKDYSQFCYGLAQYRGVFFKTQYAESYYEEEKISWALLAYRRLPYRFRVFVAQKRNGSKA